MNLGNYDARMVKSKGLNLNAGTKELKLQNSIHWLHSPSPGKEMTNVKFKE